MAEGPTRAPLGAMPTLPRIDIHVPWNATSVAERVAAMTTQSDAGAKPTDDDEPQLGDPGKRALAAERKARADAEKALKEANEQIAKFERRDLVASVATAKGVPAELSGRLQGTTKEELEADADELLKLVKPESGSTDKPKESLRSGANTEAGPAPNAAAIAAEVLK